MYLRDLIFSALLISIIRFSMSTDIQSEKRTSIVHLSSKPLTVLEDIPDRWRIVQPELKAPQIEIYLMKSYVLPSESWTFSKEYKYSNKDYDVAEQTSTTDEKKILQAEKDIREAKENEEENSDGAQDNIVMPDRIFPQIGSRNIIAVPTYCPQGQRKDNKGRCRDIITK